MALSMRELTGHSRKLYPKLNVHVYIITNIIVRHLKLAKLFLKLTLILQIQNRMTCVYRYEQNNGEAYLPGSEVNHDHEGGSSRVRPFHCTSVGLTPTITPNVGNSRASFLLVGDCVRAIPCS